MKRYLPLILCLAVLCVAAASDTVTQAEFSKLQSKVVTVERTAALNKGEIIVLKSQLKRLKALPQREERLRVGKQEGKEIADIGIREMPPQEWDGKWETVLQLEGAMQETKKQMEFKRPWRVTLQTRGMGTIRVCLNTSKEPGRPRPLEAKGFVQSYGGYPHGKPKITAEERRKHAKATAAQDTWERKTIELVASEGTAKHTSKIMPAGNWFWFTKKMNCKGVMDLTFEQQVP